MFRGAARVAGMMLLRRVYGPGGSARPQGTMTTDFLGHSVARGGRFTRALFWAIRNKHARRKIIPGNFLSRRVLI